MIVPVLDATFVTALKTAIVVVVAASLPIAVVVAARGDGDIAIDLPVGRLPRLTANLTIVAFPTLFRLLARDWRRLWRRLRLWLGLLRPFAARRAVCVRATIASSATFMLATVIRSGRLCLGSNRCHGGGCEQQADHPGGQTTH
jgi:hypothetical protein